MNHQDVLYEISIHEGALQTTALKELKKVRHSTKALIGIYTIALNCESQNLSNAAVDFMRDFISAEQQRAENVKSDVVNIRMSPKERKMLEIKAKNCKMSISEYIRHVLFE